MPKRRRIKHASIGHIGHVDHDRLVYLIREIIEKNSRKIENKYNKIPSKNILINTIINWKFNKKIASSKKEQTLERLYLLVLRIRRIFLKEHLNNHSDIEFMKIAEARAKGGNIVQRLQNNGFILEFQI